MNEDRLQSGTEVVKTGRPCSSSIESTALNSVGSKIHTSLPGLHSTPVESEAVIDVQIISGQSWGSCTARSRLQRSSWVPLAWGPLQGCWQAKSTLPLRGRQVKVRQNVGEELD